MKQNFFYTILEKISLKEIKKYYSQNHFATGSMGPKILAAIRFIESGGKKVIISHVKKGYEAFKGKSPRGKPRQQKRCENGAG